MFSLPARGVPSRFYTPFQAWQAQRLEETRQQGPPPPESYPFADPQQQGMGTDAGSGAGAGSGVEGGMAGSGMPEASTSRAAAGQVPPPGIIPGPGYSMATNRWPPPGWTAEEQLRQEAAMMLSSMRGSA